MKLQKLIYFAHGWYLAGYNSPLSSENVQAWQFGPVFPSIYQSYEKYGNHPIVCDSSHIYSFPINADAEASEIIDIVMAKYGVLTPIQLSNMTHEIGTPWEKTWDGQLGKIIPNEIIRDYFVRLADVH
jgi:uncharacterized phage-associated protein